MTDRTLEELVAIAEQARIAIQNEHPGIGVAVIVFNPALPGGQSFIGWSTNAADAPGLFQKTGIVVAEYLRTRTS